MNKELEALGYKQLKDKEWRNEDLNGRIIFLNKDTKTVISIQHNEVVKFGGMEIESLTIDELKAVHNHLQPNKEQLREEIISELNYNEKYRALCDIELLSESCSTKNLRNELKKILTGVLS